MYKGALTMPFRRWRKSCSVLDCVSILCLESVRVSMGGRTGMARRRDGFTGGLIALVMATVLLPVRPGSAQTNWVSYTPPAGWFQVDMPLMPTASQVQDTSPIGSIIAKHTKVDMIWVAGRSPTLVSQNLKATTLTYLAIVPKRTVIAKMMIRFYIVHTTE